MLTKKLQQRARRRKRTRSKITGTGKIPRVSVFRSNRHIWGQIINDLTGETIVNASDPVKRGSVGKEKKIRKTKTERANLIGEALAQKALEAGIKKVVFDRGGFKYHGRVRALAEGLRKGGLKF